MPGVLDDVAGVVVRRYLQPYTERVQSAGLLRLAAKQVHDTIWGTISLRPLEVAVLDSPLMQRLRHLRQLGVAHWVYPGADHSRFEHSLGVVYQAQQLISAINRAGLNKYNQLVISEDDQQLIRMAALLHDTGHPVLSHVSEYALRLADTLLATDHTADYAPKFLEQAGAIGEQLLQANEPEWPPEKVAERKLGYGNRGMLLFFPYNAPSQTLTCMWATGQVDGEVWEPIVRRRKKT